MASTDIKTVFEKWRSYQPRPNICRLTDARKKLIGARLKDFSAEELEVMIKWVFESNEYGPRWLRGDNPERRTYLDLQNILRSTKVPQRVEAAFRWVDQQKEPEVSPATQDGIDLGSLGALRGGRRR